MAAASWRATDHAAVHCTGQDLYDSLTSWCKLLAICNLLFK